MSIPGTWYAVPAAALVSSDRGRNRTAVPILCIAYVLL